MRFLPVARVALIILLSWVTAANGQQPAEVPRVRQIAVLSISLSEDSEEAAAFRSGLQEAGHVEGRDQARDPFPLDASSSSERCRIPRYALAHIPQSVLERADQVIR